METIAESEAVFVVGTAQITDFRLGKRGFRENVNFELFVKDSKNFGKKGEPNCSSGDRVDIL